MCVYFYESLSVKNNFDNYSGGCGSPTKRQKTDEGVNFASIFDGVGLSPPVLDVSGPGRAAAEIHMHAREDGSGKTTSAAEFVEHKKALGANVRSMVAESLGPLFPKHFGGVGKELEALMASDELKDNPEAKSLAAEVQVEKLKQMGEALRKEEAAIKTWKIGECADQEIALEAQMEEFQQCVNEAEGLKDCLKEIAKVVRSEVKRDKMKTRYNESKAFARYKTGGFGPKMFASLTTFLKMPDCKDHSKLAGMVLNPAGINDMALQSAITVFTEWSAPPATSFQAPYRCMKDKLMERGTEVSDALAKKGEIGEGNLTMVTLKPELMDQVSSTSPGSLDLAAVPKSLLNPWIVGLAPGAFRNGSNQIPFPGMGRFVLALQEDVLLGVANMVPLTDTVDISQFVKGMVHVAEQQQHAMNLTWIPIPTNAAAWVPFGFDFIMTTTSEKNNAVAMVWPLLHADLKNHLDAYQWAYIRKCTADHLESHKTKKPWSTLESAFVTHLV